MPKNAIADLYKTVNKYYEQATAYLNPIGKVYLKIVFVFRVLFIVVFLDDVFQREPKLKCETAQIGCELSCRNRFAPISHMQIWQLELFVSMLTTMVFGFFKAVQNHEFRRFKRKHPTDEEFAHQRTYWIKTVKVSAKGKVTEQKVVHSHYTKKGYLLMLLFRLCFEIICVLLEVQLGRHQSQQADLNAAFDLREKWFCSTNARSLHGYTENTFENNIKIDDSIIPPKNRSSVFHRTDTVEACGQQIFTVTCWIPFSRMMKIGLKFMFGVILLQAILTFLELMLELAMTCMGDNIGWQRDNGPVRVYEQSPTEQPPTKVIVREVRRTKGE